MGTPQVLIIEDEQSASRLISALCGEVGLSAQITRSGKEAVSLVQKTAAGPLPFACLPHLPYLPCPIRFVVQ